MCAILCGLTVAQDFRRGQQLIADRDFSDLAEFFQDAFEVCGSAGGGWDGWVGASLVGWVGQLAWVG